MRLWKDKINTWRFLSLVINMGIGHFKVIFSMFKIRITLKYSNGIVGANLEGMFPTSWL